jgi:hypothetical protein
VADPLFEHALSERCDAAVDQREKRAFLATVERVGENFEIDESLAIEYQCSALLYWIVQIEVALG